MDHMPLLRVFASALLAGSLAAGAAHAQDTIKFGTSAPKTGPLAGGAAVTHWPAIHLWVHNVNEAGGIKVGDKTMKVELVEYDDRTSNEEAIKNFQRLATVDKVDFIIAPYGTGINIATAPIIAKFGYPQIAVTAVTDKVDELAAQWPSMFFTLGTSTAFAESVAHVLTTLRDQGAIGNKVAMVSVADAFGIELANAGKPAIEKAGFDIVYETSYPLGTQDMAPIISEAAAAKPDAFIGFSYPEDTFALTEQAKIANLDVGAFYVGVATAFPVFQQANGAAAEGVLGAGGANPDTPSMQKFYADHKAVTDVDADYWASPVEYASLEILQQAIERAGTLDKPAVIKELTNGTFDTIMGSMTFDGNVNRKFWTVGQWQNGVFHGVASTGLEGEAPVIAKKGWE